MSVAGSFTFVDRCSSVTFVGQLGIEANIEALANCARGLTVNAGLNIFV
jgi:hypothetical protein